MRADNPNFRPCAMYSVNRMRGSAPRHIGFDAVGPGWHPILEELDSEFVEILGVADISKLEVVQIKEKFGWLRVYLNHPRFEDEVQRQLYAAVNRAEEKSSKTCEKCGSTKGVDTRPIQGKRFSRTLTLCQFHHEERDRLPEGQWFQIGNGDQT